MTKATIKRNNIRAPNKNVWRLFGILFPKVFTTMVKHIAAKAVAHWVKIMAASAAKKTRVLVAPRPSSAERAAMTIPP